MGKFLIFVAATCAVLIPVALISIVDALIIGGVYFSIVFFIFIWVEDFEGFEMKNSKLAMSYLAYITFMSLITFYRVESEAAIVAVFIFGTVCGLGLVGAAIGARD